MNVASWLKQAKTRIATLDAELILLAVLGETERSFLVLHSDLELSETNLKQAKNWLLQREKGVPLAYILGKKEFYGRKFLVSPAVLIPRPESETAIEILKEIEPQKVLEVGTGSGCLAITAKLELPETEMLASDISPAALRVARENAEKLGAKIEFVQSDLLTEVSGDFEVIMANLPYVDRDWDWISPELKFEPELALFAEEKGLKLIFQLICEAKGRCRALMLEADPSQHRAIIDFGKKNGYKLERTDGFWVVLIYPF